MSLAESDEILLSNFPGEDALKQDSDHCFWNNIFKADEKSIGKPAGLGGLRGTRQQFDG